MARPALLAPLDRLPIRWRLAIASALLTFLILAVFALVIGLFTRDEVRSSFDDDVRATAADLQDRVRIGVSPSGGLQLELGDEFFDVASTGGAVVRVVRPNGEPLGPPGAPDLGPPTDAVTDAGDYRVVSRPLFGRALGELDRLQSPFAPALDRPLAYVQYGKPHASVNRTVRQIGLFLVLGVAGGTGLALLAGFALAQRAMRPITGLTRAARAVARTRDPSIQLPTPEADDEVADLARTLREMLTELDAARSETESALDRQREFVADASHELRTPLTSVLANLELLEASLQDEDREVAGAALRSSRRMRRLVADLLLLARADARQRVPHERVDLGSVVRDAAAEAGSLAPDHRVEVDAPTELVVEGSRDDLHRMALNLLENAVTHTPPGTHVRARAARDGDSALLQVADDGPGVPPALRERVFERFVRGGGESASGSGLGLALVRAVAESHGGTVTLEPGPGARLLVRLPAVDTVATDTAPQAVGATRSPAPTPGSRDPR